MKKLVFLLPIAAFAMASCSNDSVVEQPATKVISAEALQIYPEIQGATRGTVWDNSNFAEFYLSTSGKFQENATDVNHADGAAFTNAKVTKSGSSWLISGKEWYWPSKTATSDFTAWAPVAPDGDPVFGPGSYTASTTIADQKDILVAFNSGSATDFESGVPLKFRHILSQIVIKADNADKTKVDIEVADVRLNNISSTGTWAVPTASTATALGYTPWSSVSTQVNYFTKVGSFASPVMLDGSAKDLTGADPLLLIPQQLNAATIASGTGQYISLLVRIKKGTTLVYPRNNFKGDANTAFTSGSEPDYRTAGVENSEQWAWTAVDVNTNWEPGKKYIYTLHFTENGYGKIDGTLTGGNTNPGDDGDSTTQDPEPGDDVVDTPVKLVLDVEVIDWEEVTEEKDM
jgi:hypothetical protein